MSTKKLSLDEMIQVFRRYMKEEGGISNIEIVEEPTQWAGICRKRALIKISDITNLDTTGIESGWEICMHDHWAPTVEPSLPPYNGEKNVDPTCILIRDSNQEILESNIPGKTQDEMYKTLKRMLPFKTSQSVIEQLKSINDRLQILEQIILKKDVLAHETRASKKGEKDR
jgi:hypothetical protein